MKLDLKNILKLILITLSLISLAYCGIIPDEQNPVLFNRPHKNIPTTIKFKFSFSEGFQLNWGNYIGVRFPAGLSSLEISDCQLYYGNDGKSYGLSKENASVNDQGITEKATTYCKFEDSMMVSLGSGNTYTLVIAMSSAINFDWFNRFSLFISTSTNSNQALLSTQLNNNVFV